MDAATRQAFANLRVHALEARDAVAAINAKIEELKNEGAVPNALRPLREELLKAQDEVKRTQSAMRDFGKASDESLLSARESTRLFGEEIGVHVPRAVSSAIAEMVPGINMLGGALLGVFAAKELYEGLGKFADWVRNSFVEQTEEVRAFSEAAAAAYKKVESAAKEAYTQFKSVAAGQFEIADIDARTRTLLRYVEAYHELRDKAGDDIRALGATNAQAVQVIAAAAKEGITSLDQAEQKLNEAGALQVEARRKMAEVEARDEKERIHQHEQDAREWVEGEKQKTRATGANTEIIERNTLTVRRWHEEMIKGEQEAGKVAAAIAKANDQATASTIRMAKAELEFTLDLEKLGVVEQKNLNFLKEYTPNVYTAAAATEHLSAARKMLIGVTQEVTQIEDAFKTALHGNTDALIAGTNALSGIVDNVTKLIGNTKASAEIRGGYDAALAIEWWARFFASYGTDPQAALTATEYTLAAAEMFKVAGSSNRAAQPGGGGGGGGGQYGREGSGEGGGLGAGQQGVAGNRLAPGASGSNGGRLNVIVIGESEQARFFASQVNAADQAGHFMQVSTARRSAPAQG